MNFSKDCIMTYSKVLIDPYNIKHEDIKIEDIAHSLSQLARANGHFKHFYSVAQHSINCALEAKSRGYNERIQLACLLHDATESYIADIPRPVKHRLIGYDVLEKMINQIIFEVFGIPELNSEETENISIIDNALLHYEFKALMDIQIFKVEPYILAEHNFEYKEQGDVYRQFIRLFKTLMPAQNNDKKEKKIIGVDGCPGGWAAFTIQGTDYDFNIYKSIQDLCKEHKDAKQIIIDMPIGLPERKEQQDLRPDADARKILKGKTSSVFNCPCRQAVYSDKQKASDINRLILGKGLSQQSIALFPKIREIDSFLRENIEYSNILIESHPEVCFAKLNHSPIMENKHKKEGQEKRLEVLSKYHKSAKQAFNSIYGGISGAGADDIIDAMCLAVVGFISLTKSLSRIPDSPQNDPQGIPMQMVFFDSNS
ncbi:MAG: DUF429 domain-containing protein [Christensenellales bacterium]